MLAISTALGLGGFALGLNVAQAQETPVQVQRLNIASTDLSSALRKQIVNYFTGGTYVPEELAECLRLDLEDLGYYEARVTDPQVSIIGRSGDLSEAEVSVRVQLGYQYYVEAITFEGVSAFSTGVLRQQFSIEPGGVFRAKSITEGLDRAKKLYAEAGYADFGAIPIPTVDEKDHRLSLAIQIDEGKQYRFGQPILRGLEPFSGAGRALLSCWSLHGKQYNPQLLKSWLAECTSSWLAGTVKRVQAVNIEDTDAAVVNVGLQFR
jgi:hypothetical protein